MKLKESLEVFEIEERRGGNFRIIKQPSINFRAFKSSCGMYIKSCLYPAFEIYDSDINIFLRGTRTSSDLELIKVPTIHIRNFKQSIKEFCEKMKWELVVSSDEYIGII